MGLPKEASNQVAGLINFARNIGGSILISLTGAEVTNRALFHQARLGNAINYGNDAYTQQVQQTGNFLAQTAGHAQGAYAAQSSIYQQLIQQSTVLGYADVYRLLAWMTVGMFFLAFLLSKPKTGEKAPEGAVH